MICIAIQKIFTGISYYPKQACTWALVLSLTVPNAPASGALGGVID